jgi:hypothetical protein
MPNVEFSFSSFQLIKIRSTSGQEPPMLDAVLGAWKSNFCMVTSLVFCSASCESCRVLPFSFNIRLHVERLNINSLKAAKKNKFRDNETFNGLRSGILFWCVRLAGDIFRFV